MLCFFRLISSIEVRVGSVRLACCLIDFVVSLLATVLLPVC